MSTGRSNRLAAQMGEFLVCAELARRDLLATPFAGTVPAFDVLATNEKCQTVPMQVKTTRSDNWPSDAQHWMDIDPDPKSGAQHIRGKAPLATPDIIYVCVAIAEPGGKDRFFVLTQSQLQDVCVAGYTAWMESKGWQEPRNPASFDCRWWIKDIQQYENNWELVLGRFRSAK